MSNRTEIKELFKKYRDYEGKELKISGWIKTIRSSSVFGFMEINDGSFFQNVQVVFEENRIDNFKSVEKLNVGSSVTVIGNLEITPNMKQPFEIKAINVVIEGESSPVYPLQKKRHSFEYLRTIAHLRPRTNTFSAVFRVRSVMAHAIHKFFQERGFVYVHTPIITSNDCEGAGELFKVTTLDMNNPPNTGKVDFSKDFFGTETGLTVSGQLAGEAYCMAFGKIYTFGPTFRAENSNTARHASEFWMIEPEIAFADIYDDMDLGESMLKYIIKYVLENAPEEMEFFNNFIDKSLFERLDNVLEADFDRITYTDAINILQASKKEFENPVFWGCDLQTEHERFIAEEYCKKPVFVINYPKEIKAFYMRLNDDGKTVAAMDLLVPGVGEIIGGSQREERYEVLESTLNRLGMNIEDYWWYADLRKFGTVKHAGYGLGFERALMYMTGMTNIRDVIPFPRTPKSAEF